MQAMSALPQKPSIRVWPLPYEDRLPQRPDAQVDLVVIHCTELPDLAMAREYGERVLYESGAGNSGHYYIDRDGDTQPVRAPRAASRTIAAATTNARSASSWSTPAAIPTGSIHVAGNARTLSARAGSTPSSACSTRCAAASPRCAGSPGTKIWTRPWSPPATTTPCRCRASATPVRCSPWEPGLLASGLERLRP
jgi:hypothetical protein